MTAYDGIGVDVNAEKRAKSMQVISEGVDWKTGVYLESDYPGKSGCMVNIFASLALFPYFVPLKLRE